VLAPQEDGGYQVASPSNSVCRIRRIRRLTTPEIQSIHRLQAICDFCPPFFRSPLTTPFLVLVTLTLGRSQHLKQPPSLNFSLSKQCKLTESRNHTVHSAKSLIRVREMRLAIVVLSFLVLACPKPVQAEVHVATYWHKMRSTA
jgi:hypothetical protein